MHAIVLTVMVPLNVYCVRHYYRIMGNVFIPLGGVYLSTVRGLSTTISMATSKLVNTSFLCKTTNPLLSYF